MVKFSFAGQRRALSKATRNALRLSRMALTTEGLAQALWPAFTVICFAVAAALLGFFARLDASSHRIVLLAVLALLAASLIWAALQFRMPSRAAAARRLDGDDPAHPIATLGDELSAGLRNDTSQRIWIEHQRRAERAAARLHAAAPDLRLARFDRWALRMFAPVMVIAGVIGAGETWTERLGTLFVPVPDAAGAPVAAAREPMVEGWVVAPGYTGQGTVYLNKLAKAGLGISVPAGSELIIRVTDLGRTPVLSAPGLTGFEGFADFGGALAEARGLLTGTGRVEIFDGSGSGEDGSGGAVMAGWDIIVVADAPPTISMPAPPGGTLTGGFAGNLEVFFEARDDYGIDTAWAEIVPMGGVVPGKGMVEEPITFALPMPIAGRALEVIDSAVQDLGKHPWAGAWVELQLFAEDGAGQRATAGPVTLRLPGRRFTHPLARALIEQRRELAMDFEQGPRVLDLLQAVTRRPEDVFSNNYGAYLGVRLAIRQLAGGVVRDDVSLVTPDVVEVLWLTALSLEDGELSSSLERLRTAEEALRRALESGTDEDVRRAMDELRAAMEEYIEEMIRQALERGLEPGEQQRGDQRMLSQEDLQEMLDEMQRQAESGMRDQAREMLSELSRMLNNLQAGRQQQQHGAGGERSLEALQEMIQRQRDLADRTFDDLRQQRRNGRREGQQGEGENGQPSPGQGGRPGGGEGQIPGQQGRPGELAAEQEALRRALEDLASQLPGGGGPGGDESTRQAIEQALEDAARAMGEARDDLVDRQPGDAVEDQMDALDRLSEGAQAMAEALSNGQGDTAGRGSRRRNGEAGADPDSDPFDRPFGAFGADDGRTSKVPNRAALDRARLVLEELRRRAAETFRPRIELDYLDRLMDQF